MSQTCIVDDCRKLAHYGYTRATHCGCDHYETDMKRITPACSYGRGHCKSIATYAYLEQEPERCGKHKKKGMKKTEVKYPSGPEPAPKLEFKNEEWSWKNMSLWEYLNEGNYPRQSSGWQDFFISHSQDLYNISEEIKTEAQGAIIYPPIHKVFRAFIPMEDIKVVILGQDPYHNGSAVGLCFSVLPGNKINPSLRSIYKELENEGYEVKRNGDLTHWANQGCLMINTALTVEKSCPEVHLGIWYEFTEKVIREVATYCKNVAFLLMGSKALKFKDCINQTPTVVDSNRAEGCGGHEIFITSHPMPLSAYKGFRGNVAFMGSGVFREINTFLTKNGRKPIRW